MISNNFYNFFIHQLDVSHSVIKKVFSSITVLALSILISGYFLLLLGGLNLRDHLVVVQKNKNERVSDVNFVLTDQNKSMPSTPISQPHSGHVDKDKINLIKRKHLEQLKKFEEWAKNNDWKMFKPEHSHYDWWMFPIMRSSSYGLTYSVNVVEIEALKADPEFMERYRRGVELVVKSWGWDLHQQQAVQNPTSEQKWTGYGVRLGKMADSLYLFGEKDLYRKLQLFFNQVCLTQIQQYPLEKWVSETLLRNI